MRFGLISNQNSWGSASVVEAYTQETLLQKPEQTILEILRPELSGMAMLDLGVGTGRTTQYFAPLVAEYAGMDYAQNMIDVCKKEFPEYKFQLGDVRSMPEYKSNYYDFVLFSYNGLDYIGHEDRLRALDEIKRVLKPGGYFVFSTHNIRHINILYSIRFLKNPKDFVYQFYAYSMLHYYNGKPSRYDNLPHTVINDGTNRFGVTTYYIRPEEQIRQMEEFGFKDIRLFSTATGDEITGQDYSENKDCWIYYLCTLG